MPRATQPGLFDDPGADDQAQTEASRARMRGMIDRLKAAPAPFWKDDAAVILDDGAFQRAMYHVPKDEAQGLWAEFDAEMVRMYALYAATRPDPGPT